jgi:hypothetical protein
MLHAVGDFKEKEDEQCMLSFSFHTLFMLFPLGRSEEVRQDRLKILS